MDLNGKITMFEAFKHWLRKAESKFHVEVVHIGKV